MNSQEVKKLYDALTKKGYNEAYLGNEQLFAKRMSNPDNRKMFYDYVKGRGDFGIGGYDEYEQRLAGNDATASVVKGVDNKVHYPNVETPANTAMAYNPNVDYYNNVADASGVYKPEPNPSANLQPKPTMALKPEGPAKPIVADTTKVNNDSIVADTTKEPNDTIVADTSGLANDTIVADTTNVANDTIGSSLPSSAVADSIDNKTPIIDSQKQTQSSIFDINNNYYESALKDLGVSPQISNAKSTAKPDVNQADSTSYIAKAEQMRNALSAMEQSGQMTDEDSARVETMIQETVQKGREKENDNLGITDVRKMKFASRDDVYKYFGDKFAQSEEGKVVLREMDEKINDITKRYTDAFGLDMIDDDNVKSKIQELQEAVSGGDITPEEAETAINKMFSERYGAKVEEEMSAINAQYGKALQDRFGGELSKAISWQGLPAQKKNFDSIREREAKYRGKMAITRSESDAFMPEESQLYQKQFRQGSDASIMNAVDALNRQTSKVLTEAEKEHGIDDRYMLTKVGKGILDGATSADWLYGIIDAQQQYEINSVVKKRNANKPLTESEQLLFDSYVQNAAANGQLSGDFDMSYKSGITTGQSLPFTMQFMTNPVSGIGEGIAASILKGTTKSIAKRVGARLVGDAVAAAGMTATSSAGTVAAETMRNMLGSPMTDIVGDNVVFEGFDSPMSFSKALGEALASQYVENQSEMVFESVGGLNHALGYVGNKVMPKKAVLKAGAMLDHALGTHSPKPLLIAAANSKPYSAVKHWREVCKNNPLVTAAAKKAHFGGIFEEYAEEVYGNVINSARGAQSWEDTFDVDKNIETFAGLAPMSVAFGMFGLGSWGLQQANALRYRRQAYSFLDEDGKAKYKYMDDMTNKGMVSADEIKQQLRAVLNDNTLGKQEKANEVKYLFTVAVDKESKDGKEKDKIEAKAMQAKLDGERIDPQERGARKSALSSGANILNQRVGNKKAAEDFAKAMDQNNGDVIEALAEMAERGYNSRQMNALANYATLYNGYQGVIEGEQKETEDAVANAKAQLMQYANRGTNRIISAQTKTGQVVFVTSGNVVTDEFSSIDKDNSDSQVIVTDPKSGKITMMEPSELFNIISDEDLDSQLIESENSIRQAKENNVVEVGNPIKYTDANGNVQYGTVIQNGNTGLLGIADANGQVVSDGMQNDDIKAVNEAAEYREGEQIAAEAMDVDNAEVLNPQTYKRDDAVVLKDGNGNEVSGTISEDADDDNKLTITMDDEFNGERVLYLTAEELDGMAVSHNGEMIEREAEVDDNATEVAVEPDANVATTTAPTDVVPISTSTTTDNTAPTDVAQPQQPQQPQQSALERIPRDEDNNPIYEATDSDTAWDAIVEEAAGDEDTAQKVIEETVSDKEKALKAKQNAKSKGGKTISEKIKAENERKKAIADAQAELDIWKNIASVRKSRAEKAKADAIAQAQAEEEAKAKEEAQAQAQAQALAEEQARAQAEAYAEAQAEEEAKAKAQAEAENAPIETTTETVGTPLDNTTETSTEPVGTTIEPSQEGESTPIEEPIQEEAQSQEGETTETTDMTTSEAIKAAEAETDTEPTERQKEAGNYKKGHVQVGTFDITIENPNGSERSGTDKNGNKWSVQMQNTYGYIRGTEGVDGDHIDVFISNDIDGWNGRRVYVMDQYNEDGTFDEHKVMLGFNSMQDAKEAYYDNYSEGWEESHPRNTMSSAIIVDFEKWINSSKRKTKAFAEYKSVNVLHEDTDYQSNVNNDGMIVDKLGNPLVFYHGTNADITSASQLESGHARVDGTKANFNGEGIELSSDKGVAMDYGKNVVRAYVTLNKPYIMYGNSNMSASEAKEFTDSLKKDGYDGILLYPSKVLRGVTLTPDEVIVFNNKSLSPIDDSVKEEDTEVSNNAVGYSITPMEYTTKKGNELNVHLVKFNERLTREQFKDALDFAKGVRGWYDRDNDGFLMRSEEDANKLAELISQGNGSVGSEEKLVEDVSQGAEEEKKAEAIEEDDKDDTEYISFIAKLVADSEDYKDLVVGNPDKDAVDDATNKIIDEVMRRNRNENLPKFVEYIGDSDFKKRFRSSVKGMLTNNDTKKEDVKPKEETATPKKETAAPKAEDNHKLVSTERYNELAKRMRDKLNKLNMGIDPEMLAIGTEMAVYHIEGGARKFAEYAKNMISDMGDAIRPYLKSFYNAVRDLPEASEFVGDMDEYDDVRKFDVANFDKQRPDVLEQAEETAKEVAIEELVEKVKKDESNKKRDGKKDIEKEKGVSSQSEKDDAEEVQKVSDSVRRKFADRVKSDMLEALENGTKPYRSIVDLRKLAKSIGMEVDDEGRTDILLQELVEDGLVRAARYVAETKGRESKESYDDICELYNMQPTIAARSSERIKMQQYSTPLPMSWVADLFAMHAQQDGKVLEPTAGNGMLVFTIPVSQVHANELDETRLSNLREQGFGEVTQNDATEPFGMDGEFDAVIANPPFGYRPAKEYDGKSIQGLDPQITLNALLAMKDGGRAAIIIGGNMEYGDNGAIKGMKPFFTYLYDHYNVKGVIDMDRKMYAKQGTSYPTRMILIDGRRSEDERRKSAIYPPVESNALAKVNNFEELYNTINEIINNTEKTNGTEILRSKDGGLVSVTNKPSGRTDNGRHPREHNEDDADRRGREGRGGEKVDVSSNMAEGGPFLLGEHRPDMGDGETGVGTNTIGGSTGSDENVVQRVDDLGVPKNGVGLHLLNGEEVKKSDKKVERKLTDEKVTYSSHSTSMSLNSVIPSAMAESIDKALSKIEDEYGDIDEFVTSELGYDSVDAMHDALAAEQVDSVAMAIYQMKHGQSLIIGDQTGVGKGRQIAALIRWGVRQGKKPIFVTKTADLISDMYRDMLSIGSDKLVPFIFNEKGSMTDNKGNVIYSPLSKNKQKEVMLSGELPDGYDYIVLTYSQVSSGDHISQDLKNKAAKSTGRRVTKKDKEKANSSKEDSLKAIFLRKIAKDNYMLLDESHNAAGDSNTGYYFQSLVDGANGVTFASATFAKRPDTMPLYAIKTAISKANISIRNMISVIENGGVTLQEIMSRALTASGQMVRRERDMSDVKTDWKIIGDEKTAQRARENYDKTISAFNRIISFQEGWAKPYIDGMSDILATTAGSAGVKKGTDKAGIDNAPFVNKAYTYTKQMLLALKVDAIIDEIDNEIKAGRHPVIALENTMESSLNDYADGSIIGEPTFSASLLRGLDSVMQYTETDSNNKKISHRISPQDLGPLGEQAYYSVAKFIKESTSDMYISPIDAIIDGLNKKGYKVGELTGRSKYLSINDKGETIVNTRKDKDKKRMAREFNSGALDVLILNKSSSTGISLHASKDFDDQRQRSMIIAQPLGDISEYMQMIGRIDRTGQVHRGYYINLGLPIPAENRFLMMLSTKLKSLNANTTTSQESENSDVKAPDLFNKYGSQVVMEYLSDNPDIYNKLDLNLVENGALDEYKAKEDDARKVTGRVALLSVKEQDAFYDDVSRRYNELIKYLDDTGNNDLKINVMPLRAKTLDKKVSSEGVDPNGDNPFAQNAYVEKVEMDVLRKPMKSSEISKAISKINNNKSNEERVKELIGVITTEEQANIDAENERYEKDKERAAKSIARQTEKINASKKRTDEEKERDIKKNEEETYSAISLRHEKELLKIREKATRIKRRIGTFEVGKSYLVPDNLESSTYSFASHAIFCGYKAKDKGMTLSTTLAVFATLDGRRRVEVKLSQENAIGLINLATSDNYDSVRSTTLDNWDSQIPTETRKVGYIMTGNILQARMKAVDENGKFIGQLVSYTDIDGEVHDGILMPEKWTPNMMKSKGAPIMSRLQQILDFNTVISTDNRVTIDGTRRGNLYHLTVPRSKKEGGVFYMNDEILKLAYHNKFFPYRGNLRADILSENIKELVRILSEMDVRVETEDDVLMRESEEDDVYRDSLSLFRPTVKAVSDEINKSGDSMAERVNELADKLHLDNVDIVTDASTLEGKKKKAKGFYNKKSGKITIVLNNNEDVADVEKTLLHEAVAHFGLRKLMGKDFDTFLDNVYDNADDDIQEKIDAMMSKKGYDKRTATEEYLAKLSEQTDFEDAKSRGLWAKIKSMFANLLKKLGMKEYSGTITDKELRYVLWRSYENLKGEKSKDLFSEAEDVAMQYELGVGEFDDLYREQEPEVRIREAAARKYEERVKTGIFQAREALQDSMLGLKEAMRAIVKGGKDFKVEDVKGFENAYLGENRLSSMNKAEADAFDELLFKPLLAEVARLAPNDKERAKLNDYMMAKHGLERNLYMAEKDADEAYEKNLEEHPNTKKTYADFYKKFRERDYGGLTGLTGHRKVADAEASADDMVQEWEYNHDVTTLWKMINDVNKATLKKSYDCGMMSKEVYDLVSNMYSNYIPLRGFDEDMSEDVYAYLNERRSVVNPALKKARGRRSKADDPLANMSSMAKSAIAQGNRNQLVKQRFLNFVLNHPSDLASVSDLWLQHDDVDDAWYPVFPNNINVGDTSEEVEQKMMEFEKKMQSLELDEPDKYMHGSNAAKIPYRVLDNRDKKEHQIIVKRGGRDYVITINGNPRAAQAINGTTNPDNDSSGAVGAMIRFFENVNRFLSGMATKYPNFMVSNFSRDSIYANSTAWIKETPNYAIKYNLNYARLNPATMRALYYKHKKGTLDMNNETDKMFRQFIINGGETGFTNLRELDKLKKEINREIDMANGKLKVARAWELLGEQFETMNKAVENCARFTAFVTSRQMGRSIDRAVYDAKEISVNFNKKGSGAKFMGAEGQTKMGNTAAFVSGFGRSQYIFWNASIQGMTNYARMYKTNPAKSIGTAATLFVLGTTIAMLAAYGSGDGDDDGKSSYYNMPEYVRRSNIMFKAGDNWVTIPLPVEFRAIYGMGELMYSVMSGNEHMDAGELALAMAGQLSQLMPIDFLEGGGGAKTLIPSYAKAFTEAYLLNMSWTGMPIYKDTPYNKNMPEYTKSYKSANKQLVEVSKFLNDVSGGDEYTKGVVDFNPAKVEYMLKSYFSGAASMVDQLTKTGEMIAGEREFDPNSVFMLNRVLKTGDERTEYRALNKEYAKAKKEHDELRTRIGKYENDTMNGVFDYAEKIDFIYNSPDYGRYLIYESYKDEINTLYDMMKDASDEEERQDIEKYLYEVKREMINEMDEARKGK